MTLLPNLRVGAIASALIFALGGSGYLFAQQEVKPCPPQLGPDAGPDSCGNTPPPAPTPPAGGVLDNYAGPMDSVQTGAHITQCPKSRYLGSKYDIPDYRSPNFTGKVIYVSSNSALQSAVDQMKPGDVVVVRKGTYSGMSLTLTENHSGTAAAPKYIVSETIHGAELFGASGIRFLGADHVVIAGFKRQGGLETEFKNNASKFVRYACNYTNHGRQASKTAHKIESPNTGATQVTTDIELDNNVSTDMGRLWLYVAQCGYYDYKTSQQYCKRNPHRVYAHSNRVFSHPDGIPNINAGEAPNRMYMFYLGLGWSHTDNSQRWPMDENNPTGQGIDNMDVILENNHFKWIQKGEWPSTDIKSSRGIYRYNCFENTRPAIRVRTGDNNMAYGNWFRGTANGGAEIATGGRGNYKAFNFYENMRGAPAVSIMRNQRFKDNRPYDMHVFAYESVRNTHAHNVYNNSSLWVRWHSSSLPDPSAPMPQESSEQHEIYGNKIYNNSGAASQYEQVQTSSSVLALNQSAFEGLNPGWNQSSNVAAKPALSGSPACFTPGYVNGVQGSVTTHPYVQGGAQRIDAPSWW